jgi:sec-independent protein translocase protein TatA
MHLGGAETWVILGIIVLLFGGKKIPELCRSLGQGIKEFKKSSKGIIDDEEEEKPAETEADSKP